MLKNAFQHNLIRSKYLKQHIKPLPNPHWGKPRFRVKSKIAAIKPVIYIYILKIAIISELNIVEPHIICLSALIFFGDSIFSNLKFFRGQTEFIFKVKVKLDLNYK